MRTIFQRLSLGVVLIALSSAVLPISDWGQRKGGAARIPRVAVVQHASQSVLDDGVRGMLDALAAEGFVDGHKIAIQRFNAENDLPTANTIARQVTTGEYDMVITSSTLSMQTVANANKAGRAIHVFGVSADPFSAGIGVNRENPLDHPKVTIRNSWIVAPWPVWAWAGIRPVRLQPNLQHESCSERSQVICLSRKSPLSSSCSIMSWPRN